MAPEEHQPYDSQPQEDPTVHVVHPSAEKEDSATQTTAHSKEGAQRENQKRSSWSNSKFIKKLFGTFAYVYFAAFVIFHVATAVMFLLSNMDPWVGLIVWLVITILGGLCVVALSLWRDHLQTFWD